MHILWDALVWAAMTATPQKHTRMWHLKLFKELSCRVISKIKFLRVLLEGRYVRRGGGENGERKQFFLLISLHSLATLVTGNLLAIYDSGTFHARHVSFYDLSIIGCAQS